MNKHRLPAVLITAILLTQQQQAAETACTPPPSGMIAWWPGDGNANDIVGNHPGTVQGGVTYASSQVAQGFTFNSPGRVNFGDIGNFGLGDFTIDLFLKTTAQSAQAILEKRPTCNYFDFWSIRITSDPAHYGQIVVELSNQTDPASSGYLLLYSNAPVNDGQMHHVALTRHGKTATLYIDGQARDTKTLSNVIRLSNSSPAQLGASVCTNVDGTQPFHGQLDEVGMFNRAVGAMDIAHIAAAPVGKCHVTKIDVKPGSCPNPVNLNGQTAIPVTIYGGPLVDVQQLDPATITLGGGNVRMAGGKYQCHVTHSAAFVCPGVGPVTPPDSYPDLVCQMSTQGATAIGNMFMFLKGTLNTPAGQRGIFGYEFVKVVP